MNTVVEKEVVKEPITTVVANNNDIFDAISGEDENDYIDNKVENLNLDEYSTTYGNNATNSVVSSTVVEVDDSQFDDDDDDDEELTDDDAELTSNGVESELGI